MADKVDGAVALGMRDRMNLVYGECARGCSRITLALDVGSRIPLASTAMGWALFAFMAPAARAAVLEELRQREPEDFERLSEGLAAALEGYATDGFVCSFSDWQREVHAVGLSLNLPDEEQSYALNCAGPAFLKDPVRFSEEVAPQLVALARLLSNVPTMTEAAS